MIAAVQIDQGGEQGIATINGEVAGQPGVFANSSVAQSDWLWWRVKLIGRVGDDLEPIETAITANSEPAIWSDGLDTLVVLGMENGNMIGVDGASRESTLAIATGCNRYWPVASAAATAPSYRSRWQSPGMD